MAASDFNVYQGRNAHFFQPPHQSPALATTATANDYFSPQWRKRQRPGSSHSQPHALQDAQYQQTPRIESRFPAETPSWVQCPTPSDTMYNSAYAQSSALVNERYNLKGGFDTPGLTATSTDARVGDGEFRRRVWETQGHTLGEDSNEMLSGPLARERNGVARMQTRPYANGPPAIAGGWTEFAFDLVEKVFSFGTSVIKGFYAGGGKGYDMQQQRQPRDLSNRWTQMQPSGSGAGTPVPGAWQEDEFLGDLEQDNPSYFPSSHTSRPSNKRRQTDRDTWVVVGTPDIADLTMSPKRKPSGGNVPRASLGSRPSASRANSRRSIAPIPRRTSSYVTHSGSPAQPPFQHQQQQQQQQQFQEPPHRRASIAPIRSPRSHSRPSSAGVAGVTAAALSPEAERILKRQAKHERATDKTMSSMNRQLRDLIQQAQQALGTKYAVEGGGTGEEEEISDEGFVDEEW